MYPKSYKTNSLVEVLGRTLGFLIADFIGLFVANAVFFGGAVDVGLIFKLVLGYQMFRLVLGLLFLAFLESLKN